MCQFLPLVKESKEIIRQNPDLELSFKDIKDIIDQLPRIALLTFTGGEPLLRKDIVEILLYAARRNKCHLITNGTLLNENKIYRLADIGLRGIAGSGLVMIEVSLEGTQDVHDKITSVTGSYNKTIDSIKMIDALKKQKKQRYPLINITVVITNKNIHILPEMVDLAKELNVDILSFLSYSRFPHFERLKERVILNNNSIQDSHLKIDRELLLRQIDCIRSRAAGSKLQIRFSPHGVPVDKIVNYYTGNVTISGYICRSPWTKAIITSCGDIMFCSNYILGSLKKQKFSTIWNGDRSRDFRKRLKSKGVFSQCIGCCMLEKGGLRHKYR